MMHSTGFSHFIGQTDWVSQSLLIILTLMSCASWYLIFSKTFRYWKTRGRARLFLQNFWQAENIHEVESYLKKNGVQDPFSHLVHHGLRAAQQHQNKTSKHMIEAGSADEFLTRALRRAIEQDTARLEYGHTLLASVAASAPFLGLFGTVLGIYHALLAISASGQGSLDQVAGPVGEALIMTALGLAVAIPAVLAYNAFTRANRLVLSELDGFAHDFFAFMSTGMKI